MCMYEVTGTMNDVNEMWIFFKYSLMEIIDDHLPFNERRINKRSEQWIINVVVLTEMHQRDYLHSQALKTNSEYDWALYKYILALHKYDWALYKYDWTLHKYDWALYKYD